MNLETRLIELFNTLPAIEVDGVQYPVNFDFGNENDKNNYLVQKNKEGVSIYPLIWLVSGQQEVEIRDGEFETEIDLILATLTSSTLSNRERLLTTFDSTLFPLHENVIKAFERSGFTKIIEKKPIVKYFNYSESNKTTTLDIWDAIKIGLKIQYNNCKINTIINY
jgi:hypothetical protein